MLAKPYVFTMIAIGIAHIANFILTGGTPSFKPTFAKLTGAMGLSLVAFQWQLKKRGCWNQTK